MKSAKVKLLDQARVRVGAYLLVLLMWGCGDSGNLPPTERLASPRISLGADELPRDRWLTLNDAIPISPDGAIVKDEADRPYGYVRLGQAVPNFSTTAFGGGQVTQEAFRGKWTIIDFWGVWCGDCRVDAPLVEALARDLRDDPELSFLSIHSPPSRERADEAYGQFGSLDAYFAARRGLSHGSRYGRRAERGLCNQLDPDLSPHWSRSDHSGVSDRSECWG